MDQPGKQSVEDNDRLPSTGGQADRFEQLRQLQDWG
jgi:hypothetical protein